MRLSLPRPVRRGLLALTLVGGTLAAASLATPAQADDSGTLTVVGTSDVFDSHLVQDVLEPGFEAAYPQYDLNYVSKGTGAAIAYAEAGTASAMLVHAASLENQFVDQGFSAEKYGRAIFYGDYVLLGPASDPAGVLTGAPHDIVGAFEKVAAAGAAGRADFVSRGGTPGTTVQEHAIWKLTSGVTSCTVSDANGGGTSPSTTTGDCPTSIDYPSWYHATGLTQGPNLTNADTCNYGNGQDCYVLTDRGTYEYLKSQNAVSNLGIVTRDNATAATGGPNLLVNSFHAYAVNPAKFKDDANVQLNTPAATAFLNWVTSPAAQAAVGAYLNGSDDAPFLPSAAPAVTTSTLPGQVTAGTSVTVTGSIRNVVPGTLDLAGETVRLYGTSTATGHVAALTKATTNPAGAYKLTFTPRANQAVSVVVPAITKVEDAELDPVFGDLLAATTTKLSTLSVKGVPRISSIKVAKRVVTFGGTVGPAAPDSHAHLSLYGAPTAQASQGLSYLGQRLLSPGSTSYSKRFTLKKGAWTLQLRYVDAGQIVAGSTAKRKVTVR